MADLPNFPEELRPGFRERLEMAAWNWEQGWAALEDLAEKTRRNRRTIPDDINILAPAWLEPSAGFEPEPNET